MDRSKMEDLLEQFLKERRISKGGWAEVTDEDKTLLSSLLRELLLLKFELDPDGDLPVEYVLVDRTERQSLHYRSVPYFHKDSNGAFRVAFANVKTAVRELDECLGMEQVVARFGKV